MKEKVTPGQCLNFGAVVAMILGGMDADKDLTQLVIDKTDHPLREEIREALAATLVQNRPVFDLLGDQTNIPAQSEFAVATYFTVDNSAVKFRSFGINFLTWFGSLVERPVTMPTRVLVDKIKNCTSYADVHERLTPCQLLQLSQLYWLLTLQPRGLNFGGVDNQLVTHKDLINLSCAFDLEGVERWVTFYWFETGWVVDALPVPNKHLLKPGNRVLHC